MVNIASLSVLNLGWWQRKIKHHQEAFEEINFHHIYREYNSKVYKLSKEALVLDEGLLLYGEWKNSLEVSRGSLRVFILFMLVVLFGKEFMAFWEHNVIIGRTLFFILYKQMLWHILKV